MLFEIVVFLLDIVVGLISGACLLRMYMQAQRVPFGNPVGQLVLRSATGLFCRCARSSQARGAGI